MLIMRADKGYGNYERYYAVASINIETLHDAYELFEDYRENGVILNNCFSDTTWTLTNQICRKTIMFEFSETGFRKYTASWIGCNYNVFCDSVKAYILFLMGNTGLQSLAEIARSFYILTENSEKQLVREYSEYTRHIAELLQLLPSGCESRDAVLEEMEEKNLFGINQRKDRKQRILADFSLYFRFHDDLNVFWKTANQKEKLFFFPLYFWWNLTSILPLRPTEFLLTPRDCVSWENGEYILTLRRTARKGYGKKITYRVEGDYKPVKYAITKIIATEIQQYLVATENMELSKLSTLFVTKPNDDRFGRTGYDPGIYYTYARLSNCLRIFQTEIMGVGIENDDRIRLGDTRHLAMIGLIISGGSPVICRELAGHEDIGISAHYYSNISRFVECATYELYRKKKGYAAELLSHRQLILGANITTVQVFGGYCDSEVYRNSGIQDCIRCISPSGEIGDCKRCPHFIDENSGMYLLFSNPQERKEQVDRDSSYLIQVLEQIRKGIGCKEDLQSALLRLQNSSTWYSQCLQYTKGGH